MEIGVLAVWGSESSLEHSPRRASDIEDSEPEDCDFELAPQTEWRLVARCSILSTKRSTESLASSQGLLDSSENIPHESEYDVINRLLAVKTGMTSRDYFLEVICFWSEYVVEECSTVVKAIIPRIDLTLRSDNRFEAPHDVSPEWRLEALNLMRRLRDSMNDILCKWTPFTCDDYVYLLGEREDEIYMNPSRFQRLNGLYSQIQEMVHILQRLIDVCENDADVLIFEVQRRVSEQHFGEVTYQAAEQDGRVNDFFSNDGL